MKLNILKNFRVGSISDPKRMVAGNVIDVDESPERVAKWVEMGWVEVI